MIEFDITAHGMEEQLKKLAMFDLYATRRFEEAMHKAVVTVQSAIIPNVPVGVSGRLKNSIGSEVKTESPGSVVGTVGSSLKDEEYPAVMEHGREPGAKMPPPEALVRWVHVKRLAGTYSIKTHKRTGSKKTQVQEDMDVAFMVARSIGRRGIKGRHFMKGGFEKTREKVIRFFHQAAQQIAKDVTNGS